MSRRRRRDYEQLGHASGPDGHDPDLCTRCHQPPPRRVPGVRHTLRLHYPGGKVVTEPLTRFARENGVDRAGALTLLQRWLDNGSMRARPDGGFDVVRVQPRQVTPR